MTTSASFLERAEDRRREYTESFKCKMKHEGSVFSPDGPGMKEEIREFSSASDGHETEEDKPPDKSCDHGQKVSRKVGEKLRRDRLNSLVAALAEEVPFVVSSHRRLDKTAVLRLTVSYLKLHHGLKRKRLQQALGFDLSGGPYTGLFEQAVNGSLLIASESGEILFVSPNIRDIVGHNQTDLIGHNISAFIHPDDLQMFKSQFQDRPRVSSSGAFATFHTDQTKNKVSNIELVESCESENFSMYIRLARAVKKRTDSGLPKQYELLSVRGHIDIPAEVKKSLLDDSGRMWMVAVLKPAGNQAIREVNVGMSEFLKNNEWATQHGLDGKLWTVDHRGTLFHGYMVSEVLGNTPYMFVKDDDLEYVARSHKLIMKENEIPSTVFRMKNKYSLDLYVQSRSIIISDRWTRQPKCIVSVNTVLSKDEGVYLLEEQKRRVQKLIAQTEQLALTDTETLEDSGRDSKEFLDPIIDTSAIKREKNDRYTEVSVPCMSYERRHHNGGFVSEYSPLSSSPLDSLCISSDCHRSDSVFTSSGSPGSHSNTGSSVECHIIGSEVHPESNTGTASCFSDTSEPSSVPLYGVKRSHEALETDFDFSEIDESDTQALRNSNLRIDNLQCDTISNHSQAFLHHTALKSNVDQENLPKAAGSYPVLKQILASNIRDHESKRWTDSEQQCHINASGDERNSEIDSRTQTHDFSLNRWAQPVYNEQEWNEYQHGTGMKGFHSGSKDWNLTPSQNYESDSLKGGKTDNCQNHRRVHIFAGTEDRKLDQENRFSSQGGLHRNQFPADQSGLGFQQTLIAEPGAYSCRDVQSTVQNQSCIATKLSSQLQDKHIKLKQALGQQQTVLDSVGNQLTLGQDTVLSHDQQKLHGLLLDRLSDMKHQMHLQTGILSDLEEELKTKNQQTEMDDFFDLEEKR